MKNGLGLVRFVDVVLVFWEGEAGLLNNRVLGEMNMLGQMANGVS